MRLRDLDLAERESARDPRNHRLIGRVADLLEEDGRYDEAAAWRLAQDVVLGLECERLGRRRHLLVDAYDEMAFWRAVERAKRGCGLPRKRGVEFRRKVQACVEVEAQLASVRDARRAVQVRFERDMRSVRSLPGRRRLLDVLDEVVQAFGAEPAEHRGVFHMAERDVVEVADGRRGVVRFIEPESWSVRTEDGGTVSGRERRDFHVVKRAPRAWLARCGRATVRIERETGWLGQDLGIAIRVAYGAAKTIKWDGRDLFAGDLGTMKVYLTDHGEAIRAAVVPEFCKLSWSYTNEPYVGVRWLRALIGVGDRLVEAP